MRAGIFRLTRQVVSVPAPAGETLRNRHRVAAVDRVDPGGTRALHAHERPVARLSEKLRVDQRAEQRITDLAFKTPEALRLRGGQSKPGHFYELTLNPLKHVINAHRLYPVNLNWGPVG